MHSNITYKITIVRYVALLKDGFGISFQILIYYFPSSEVLNVEEEKHFSDKYLAIINVLS
jgi:hypothetical protein